MGTHIDKTRKDKEKQSEEGKERENNKNTPTEQIKIFVKCIIQATLVSLFTYIFGISSICIATLPEGIFDKAFPKILTEKQLDADPTVKCTKKKPGVSPDTHYHSHTHTPDSTTAKTMNGGYKSSTKRKTAQKGGSTEKPGYLTKTLNDINKKLHCRHVEFDTSYQERFPHDKAYLEKMQERKKMNPVSRMFSSFWDVVSKVSWKLTNSLFEGFWYSPQKIFVTFFKYYGNLANMLYKKSGFAEKAQLVKNAVQPPSADYKPSSFKNLWMFGGIVGGMTISFILSFAVFFLVFGSWGYATLFPAAKGAKSLYRFWSALATALNPFLFPVLFFLWIAGFIGSGVMAFIGGIIYERKLLMKLFSDNVLILAILFYLSFLGLLASSDLTDKNWIAAAIAALIGLVTIFKRLVTRVRQS